MSSALYAMGAAKGFGTLSNIFASGAATAAKNRAINEQKYYGRVKKSFNEEKLRLDTRKIQMDYLDRFVQRGEAYNKVRNVQLSQVGYQGRTLNSLQGIMASDDANFEYDNEVDSLNEELNLIELDLQNTYANWNIDRQAEEAENQIKANVEAQTWATLSAITGAASTFIADDIKYGKTDKSGKTSGGYTGFNYGGEA